MISKDLLPIIGQYARPDVYTLNISNRITAMIKTFYLTSTEDIVKYFHNNPTMTYWLMVRVWNKIHMTRTELSTIVPNVNWNYVNYSYSYGASDFYLSESEFPKLTYKQIKTVIDILLVKQTNTLKKLEVTDLQ